MYIKNKTLEVTTRVVKNMIGANRSISLFLEGVPGSGKTAFAKALSEEVGAKLFRYDCSEESNSNLLVSYDLEGIIKREAAYIKGPLWEAFDENTPTVLLIDEIDKSPKAFEAFLLRTTDEQEFRSPKGETITAQNPVVFVFTSNGRRKVSPEFLRRNMRIHLEYPKGDLLKDIVREILGDSLYLESQLALVCHAVDVINGKVEPDELPSPKEIAILLENSVYANEKEEMVILLTSFFLKNLQITDLNQLLSFDLAKGLYKKLK